MKSAPTVHYRRTDFASPSWLRQDSMQRPRISPITYWFAAVVVAGIAVYWWVR